MPDPYNVKVAADALTAYELEPAGERRKLASIHSRQTLISFGLGGGLLGLLMLFSGSAREIAAVLAIAGVVAIPF
jgi:hypothetical protein